MPDIITDPVSAESVGLNGAANHLPVISEPVAKRPRLEFLVRMANEGVVSWQLAEVAQDVWKKAQQQSRNRLPEPVATADEGGQWRSTGTVSSTILKPNSNLRTRRVVLSQLANRRILVFGRLRRSALPTILDGTLRTRCECDLMRFER